MALKTLKYRLYPSDSQEKRMFQVLAVCRQSPRRDLPQALKRSLQQAVRQARADTIQ